MAARDYENLLQACHMSFKACSQLNLCQCAIPVFDGLLPEPHNRRILQLLFVTAHWHGLAKLRFHNDLTLNVLDSVTESLGKKLREFRDGTCSAFATRELEREFNARVRRQTKSMAATHVPIVQNLTAITEAVVADACAQQTIVAPARNEDPTAPIQTSGSGPRRRRKVLNLNTYKTHSLGDYAATIRRYGTTDSYTTESVRNNVQFSCYVDVD